MKATACITSAVFLTCAATLAPSTASADTTRDTAAPAAEDSADTAPPVPSASPLGEDPPPSDQSPEPSVAVYWDASLASKYLFQGADLSNGNPVIQPEIGLDSNGVSALVWANFDMKTGVVDEVDLYLQYGWEVQNLSIAPGYAYFDYPNRGWDSSQELLVDLSYASILSPSMSFHYDFDAGDGSYTTLGVSHEIATSLAPAALGLNLFYQNNYYGLTGIPAMEMNVSTVFEVGPAAITPSISYVSTWENGDFQGDSAVPTTWLFSLNLAQSF